MPKTQVEENLHGRLLGVIRKRSMPAKSEKDELANMNRRIKGDAGDLATALVAEVGRALQDLEDTYRRQHNGAATAIGEARKALLE